MRYEVGLFQQTIGQINHSLSRYGWKGKLWLIQNGSKSFEILPCSCVRRRVCVWVFLASTANVTIIKFHHNNTKKSLWHSRSEILKWQMSNHTVLAQNKLPQVQGRKGPAEPTHKIHLWRGAINEDGSFVGLTSTLTSPVKAVKLIWAHKCWKQLTCTNCTRVWIFLLGTYLALVRGFYRSSECIHPYSLEFFF